MAYYVFFMLYVVQNKHIGT